jgi:hypothetical protein
LRTHARLGRWYDGSVAQPETPLAAASRLSRQQFVTQFPEPLLVGHSVHELAGHTTLPVPSVSWEDTAVASNFGAAQLATLVCSLRKVQKIFPRMITVGRTSNSDLVIPDDSVSKLHAFFQRLGDSNVFGLTDAESTNGTFLNDVRLTAHATPVAAPPGSRVRFGRIALTVMEGAAFWDSLRYQPPPLPGSGRGGAGR